MGRIPSDTVDQIFNAAIIEEVIGDFVQLKKSGANYKGLSPFTDEKTPSFVVSPAKGIFKCFSTGKAGNVTKFLMEHEKLTFPEALRWLADKYRIEIEEEEVSDEEREKLSEKESLSIVVNYAKQWFVDQLWTTEEGQQIGLSYFKERGFREDIIRKFELGYCPDQWDTFSKAAFARGYEAKYLETTGLIKTNEKGSFDFYKGRVTFPIRNITGKAIGFGARTLRSDKKVAKYFNSPDNPLYHKSHVLYGIDLARNEMVKQDRCYLVEGYTDVISMHQCGVENVVASSGTSLTEGQIALIKRYTKNITILFDGDAAGIKASFRGIDMILKEGLNVRVVLFPEGEDPDSYAMAHSSSEVEAFLDQSSKDFIVFKTDLLAKEAAGDPIKRAGLIREIVSSIALIPDQIKRSVYIQECSQLLDMDERILLQESNKLFRKQVAKQEGVPLPVTPVPQEQLQVDHKLNTSHQEKDFVRLLLNYGRHVVSFKGKNDEGEVVLEEISVAEYLCQQLTADQLPLENPILNTIYEDYCAMLENGKFPDERYFSQHPNAEVSGAYANFTLTEKSLSKKWELHKIYTNTEEQQLAKAVKDCVYRLKLRKVQVMLEGKQEELKNPELDEAAMEMLLRDCLRLTETKMLLTNYFGSTII